MNIDPFWHQSPPPGAIAVPLLSRRGDVRAYALTDECYGSWARAYIWRMMVSNGLLYAVRTETIKGKTTTFLMHRVIANTPQGSKTDHWNGDTLDNRLENLRACTHAENMRNRSIPKNNTLGYKGVVRKNDMYIAVITVDGRALYLGTYPTAVEAAEAYNRTAQEVHGDYARLNDLGDVTLAEQSYSPTDRLTALLDSHDQPWDAKPKRGRVLMERDIDLLTTEVLRLRQELAHSTSS